MSHRGSTLSSVEWTWGWAAVVVSFMAAGVAGWQAWEARRARRDASSFGAAAERSAVEAASAQAQSAQALASMAAIAREQHEAARAAAATKPDPWRLEPGRYMKTGKAIMLKLTGSDLVRDVELVWERKPALVEYDPSPVPTTMRPGDAIEIVYMFTGGGSTAVLEVHWRREGEDEVRVTRGTLN